jgi:fructokinase
MVIAVIGEALVDIVEDSTGVRQYPGGGPLNIAVGLARLGCEVELFADVGEDELGDSIRNHVSRENVRLASPRHSITSTAHAKIDVHGAARYEFDVRWDPGLPVFTQTPEILHVGSLGAFLSPGDSVVSSAVRDAPAATLVSFDPNIRPQLIPSATSARRTTESLLAGSDVVKLSDEDAAYIWPAEHLTSVLDRILERGPALAVVTRGSEGAVLATRSGVQYVEAPATDVRDTIGAGDSFMAGLLFALREGAQSVEGDGWFDDVVSNPVAVARAARFAVACAAVTVSRAGANPPRLAEVAVRSSGSRE